MKRLRWVLLTLLLPAAASAQAISTDALSKLPVRLDLDKTIWRAAAGSTIELHVSIRNAFGQPVPAAADTAVEVRSSMFDKAIPVVVKAGATSAVVSFTAPAGQSGKIVAVADKLSSASCFLVVGAAAEASTPPATLPKPEPTPAPAGASPGSQPGSRPDPRPRPLPTPGGAHAGGLGEIGLGGGGGGGGNGTGLGGLGGAVGRPRPGHPSPVTATHPALRPRILVNPEQVRPDGRGQWMATLKVGVFDEGDRLVQASDDFPVQFTAHVGRLSSDVVSFKAGQYLSPEVSVVSTSGGTDQVTASTPLGTAGPTRIAYELPAPAKLRVFVSPDKVTNTGGAAPVQVSVLLTSEADVPTSASDRDITVSLGSTLGQLEKATLTIPRGAPGAMTSLTSARSGRAVITASAAGFSSDQATVKFSFPLLLAFLAGLGGLAGSFLVRPREFAQRSKMLRSAVIGLVVGVLFYAVASFRAFSSGFELPLPIDISRILTGNELGALVLGCVGGALGRAFWRPKSGKRAGRPHDEQGDHGARATG